MWAHSIQQHGDYLIMQWHLYYGAFTGRQDFPRSDYTPGTKGLRPSFLLDGCPLDELIINSRVLVVHKPKPATMAVRKTHSNL